MITGAKNINNNAMEMDLPVMTKIPRFFIYSNNNVMAYEIDFGMLSRAKIMRINGEESLYE